MALKHTTAAPATPPAPGTTIGGNQYNEDHVVDQDGLSFTSRVDSPPNAAAGKMLMFARNVANKMIPSYIGADGGVSTVQSHLGRGKSHIISPSGNGINVTSLGGGALSATSMTTATRLVSTTSLLNETRRLGYITGGTPTANTAYNTRSTLNQYCFSSSAGRGGFFCIVRFGLSAKIAGDRMFYGMGSATAAYAVADPSTFLNMVGIGYDAADTQWQIMHNDGAGTATRISLGANFTINTTDLLEVILFAEAGAGAVCHTLVRNLSTGLSDTVRTISTDLPAVNTLMQWHGQINTGATASVSGYDLVSFYIETDT